MEQQKLHDTARLTISLCPDTGSAAALTASLQETNLDSDENRQRFSRLPGLMQDCDEREYVGFMR